MSGDGTYAPKSPDLSSFYSAGPTPPAEPELEPAEAPQQQHRFLSPQSQPEFSRQSFASSSAYQHPHAPHSAQQHHQLYQDPRDTPPQPLALEEARPTHDPSTSQPLRGFSVGVAYPPTTTTTTTTTQHEYHPPRAQSYPQPAAAGYTVAQAPQEHHRYQQQPAFHQPSYRGSGSFQYQYRPTAGPPQPQFPAETPQHLLAAQAQVQHHQQPYDYPPAVVPTTATAAGEAYAPPGHPGHQAAAVTLPANHHQYPHQPMPPRRAAAAAAAAAFAAQAAASDSGPETRGGDDSSPNSPPTTTTNPSSTTPSTAAAAFGGFEPGPVKTKFPTARIKRIMQADEEVGKVAQQTPIAVGKALELFMVALVSRSAGVARARNSKRVSAAMLRQAVESDEQWDFLGEIVAKVEAGGSEDKAGKGAKGKAGAESESEDEGGGAGAMGAGGEGSAGGSTPGAKRKRGGGGGRKKKVQ